MQHKLRITATQREISLCKGNTHYCVVTLTLCFLSLNVNSVRLSSLSPFFLSVCLIPQPTPPPLCVVSLSCHTPSLSPLPNFMSGACLLLLPSCGCVPSFFSFSVTLFLPTSLFMLLLPSPCYLPVLPFSLFHYVCFTYVCNHVSLFSPLLSISLLLVFMSTPSLSSHFLPQIPAAEPGSGTWACHL